MLWRRTPLYIIMYCYKEWCFSSSNIKCMSCSECGSSFVRKNLIKLYLATASIIVIFAVSLFFAKRIVFIPSAIGVLFALRKIEIGFNEVEKHKLRCPSCGCVARVAHSHDGNLPR